MDRAVAGWYRWYRCPRGKHKMKMSGCLYCGRGDGRIKLNVRG